MDSFIIILLVGAIALAGSVMGGYRLAQMRGRNRKTMRAIGFIIALVIIAIALYFEFQDVRMIQEGNPPTAIQPTTKPMQIEALTLNQSETYTLNLDDEVALTYEGELGQVVTLTIIPETGTSPTVFLSSQVDDNPPVPDGSIRARGKQTIVCGYQFDFNGTFTFMFTATDFTNYTVEFVEGNSCRND